MVFVAVAGQNVTSRSVRVSSRATVAMEPLLSLMIKILIDQTLAVLLPTSHHGVRLEIAPVPPTLLGYQQSRCIPEHERRLQRLLVVIHAVLLRALDDVDRGATCILMEIRLLSLRLVALAVR